MSDAGVTKVLDDLEGLLENLLDDPDPQAVADWHDAFREAVAGAERGPGWQEIRNRAHELGRRLEQRTGQLQALRGAIREELLAQERGHRALEGYRQPGAQH
jgi:hypothetical protein